MDVCCHVPRLHKLPANVQHWYVYFEYICWKFAKRLLDRVNTPLICHYNVALRSAQ